MVHAGLESNSVRGHVRPVPTDEHEAAAEFGTQTIGQLVQRDDVDLIPIDVVDQGRAFIERFPKGLYSVHVRRATARALKRRIFWGEATKAERNFFADSPWADSRISFPYLRVGAAFHHASVNRLPDNTRTTGSIAARLMSCPARRLAASETTFSAWALRLAAG